MSSRSTLCNACANAVTDAAPAGRFRYLSVQTAIALRSWGNCDPMVLLNLSSRLTSHLGAESVYLPSKTPLPNNVDLPKLSKGFAAGQNRARFSAESVRTFIQASGNNLCNRSTATCSMETSPMLPYSSMPLPKPVSTKMFFTMISSARVNSYC